MILIPRVPHLSGRRCGVRLWAGLAVLACLVAPGCAKRTDGGAAATGDSKPAIVAGFYPLYEAASRIGGDRFEVVNLTPAGAEPHDLELTPAEVQRTLGARLVLYLGGGFQPALESTARQRGGSSIDILEGMSLRSAPAVSGEPEEGEEEESLPFDPHVWLDPVLMSDVVARTETVLKGIDRPNAGTFAQNAQAYRTELATLDADYRAGLANCPRKAIVTSHAAFGYLAQRYGLTQQAISGLSPESEPSPKRLQELAALVKDQGVTTIFTESLVSPRTADALARETGATTAVLNPIEGLTKEELEAGKNYLTIMRDNLATLRTALGCQG